MTIGIAVIGAGWQVGRTPRPIAWLPPLPSRSCRRCGTSPSPTSAPSSGAGGSALRLRAVGHLLEGDRRRPRHPRRQRGGGQLAASRDGGRPGGGREARAVREAAQRHPRGRAGDGRGRPQRRHRGRIGLHLPPRAGSTLRELVTSGTLGRVLHVDVRYWCDYASDPQGPISWRYKGAREPARSPTSAATPRTWRSSSAATRSR